MIYFIKATRGVFLYEGDSEFSHVCQSVKDKVKENGFPEWWNKTGVAVISSNSVINNLYDLSNVDHVQFGGW